MTTDQQQTSSVTDPSARRLWMVASTPTPEDVIAVRCCVGESFRDGDAVLMCDGVCLSGNLTSMVVDLLQVPRVDAGSLEPLDALAARFAGRLVGREEAQSLRAGGWW
jgi:hypothetical protein